MKFEFSAGGIVYKKTETGILILLGQHSAHHRWVFPKGLIGDHVQGEGKEETAIREVEEETGVLGRIVSTLTPVTFWYAWQGEKRKKTVYYYVMEYVSEDPSKRDNEMENVEWLPFDAVEGKLTYAGDKKLWREAMLLINKFVNQQ